jgi:hypothetical protein
MAEATAGPTCCSGLYYHFMAKWYPGGGQLCLGGSRGLPHLWGYRCADSRCMGAQLSGGGCTVPI